MSNLLAMDQKSERLAHMCLGGMKDETKIQLGSRAVFFKTARRAEK